MPTRFCRILTADDPLTRCASTIRARPIGTVSRFANLFRPCTPIPRRRGPPDVSLIEGRIPRQFGADAVEIPGARELLASVEKASVPWAVVTSGSRALVQGWIEVLHLARPDNLVVAEDVTEGKPGNTRKMITLQTEG